MKTVAAGTLRPTLTTTIDLGDQVEVSLEDRDRTRPFLLLHGGGGPRTMTGFADLLAERTHSRVLLPTHPGFAGTARSSHLSSTRELAAAYVQLLDQVDLTDVTVIGNSFGGWLAAEMALHASPRVSGAIIMDGIGAVVAGHPITDVSGLTPAELAALSWHDPRNAPAPPTAGGSGPSPDIQALISYAGPAMSDPTLLERVADIDIPVHVIWGASDGIVDPSYGRALAEAIPGSAFTVLPRAGHLPQMETPEELLEAIWEQGR